MPKRYVFKDWLVADACAGGIYYELSQHPDLEAGFENLEGHGHQRYHIYPNGIGIRTPELAALSFEYNGIEDPPYLEFNMRPTIHSMKIQKIIDEALSHYEVQEVKDTKRE